MLEAVDFHLPSLGPFLNSAFLSSIAASTDLIAKLIAPSFLAYLSISYSRAMIAWSSLSGCIEPVSVELASFQRAAG